VKKEGAWQLASFAMMGQIFYFQVEAWIFVHISIIGHLELKC